jgi:hypothetical protein
MMSAELTWNSGRVDTTTGLFSGVEPLIYFGEGAHGDFIFKAHLDSIDSPNSTPILYGPFVDTARGIEGYGRATQVACLPEPGENLTCFDFKQMGEEKIIYGRMGIDANMSPAIFYVHWHGIGSRLGQGIVIGDLDSSASVSGVVIPPPGLFPKDLKVDSAFLQFQVSGPEINGAYLHADYPTQELGAWYGNRDICISHDFRW